MAKIGWVTHCKTAFLVEAKMRYYQQKNTRFDLIAKEMSAESGIPANILIRWYAESRAPIPICKMCKKNSVDLSRVTAKPWSKKYKYHGLCKTCIDKKQRPNRVR